MLAIGIDPAAEGIAVLERPGVAGRDTGLETAVLAERQHLGTVLARDARGPVGRSVVDDEDVGVWQLATELVEHGREIALLVPGRDEDQRVTHPARVAAC